MGDPDYVYQPWSNERRKAASKAASIQLYGSEQKAKKARRKNLKTLLARRARLKKKLGLIESNIRQIQKQLIKEVESR